LYLRIKGWRSRLNTSSILYMWLSKFLRGRGAGTWGRVTTIIVGRVPSLPTRGTVTSVLRRGHRTVLLMLGGVEDVKIRKQTSRFL
jgi:hypothetical protein